jgi:hypothetical protein
MRQQPIYLRPGARTRGFSVVGRGLAGRSVFGPEKTNARWGRGGTGPPDDHAGWWAHQSYRRRSAIRLLVVLGPIAYLIGRWVDPAGTARLVRVAGLIGLLVLVSAVVHWSRRWSHYKTWTVAVALTAGKLLNVSRHRRPRDWVHIPPGHRDDPDKPMVIDLPDNFSWPVGRREKLALALAATGGVQHPDWYFALEARPKTLTIRAMPSPPELVTFAEVVAHLPRLDPRDVLWGFRTGRQPFTVSLVSDSPHILVSAGPGGGKSAFLCWLCLQFFPWRPRPRVIFLDFVKGGSSCKWAKEFSEGPDPLVEVIREVDEAHDLILELFAEIKGRTRRYWHHGYDPDERHILIVMDEGNQSWPELQRYSRQVLGVTGPSAAIGAMQGILQVGREANATVVQCGQRGSHRGTGGGDQREAFGVVAASRFTPRTAKMLFSDVGDGRAATLPVSSNHRGRFQVATGGVATEVQAPLCIDPTTKLLLPEAREWVWATVGASVPAAADPGSDPGVFPGREGRGVAGSAGSRPLHVVPDPPSEDPDEEVGEPLDATELVTLRRAAERLPGDTQSTLDALQNDRKRHREAFPAIRRRTAQGDLYDFDELRRHWLHRPSAGGAS